MSQPTRTSTTLLEGLFDPHNVEAWRIFDARYRPLVLAYASRRGLRSADAEDLAQDALLAFAQAYRDEQYDRTRGRLRHWLGGIAHRRYVDLIRKRDRGIEVVRGEGKTAIYENLPDPDEPDKIWEEEWEAHVLAICTERIRGEFGKQYWYVFEEYVLKNRSADEVARELDVTRNAVYVCKSKLLARVREIREALESAS